MKPTHYYTDDRGHDIFGLFISDGPYNFVWFLPLCEDGKTYMKEPVCALGVFPIP